MQFGVYSRRTRAVCAHIVKLIQVLRTGSIDFLGCTNFQVVRLNGFFSGHPLRGEVGEEQLRLWKKVYDGPILASKCLCSWDRAAGHYGPTS